MCECTHACVRPYVHVCMRESVCMCAYMHVCICACIHVKAGSQYDATQPDAGRGVNCAGIGSISNPALRRVALALCHIVNQP